MAGGAPATVNTLSDVPSRVTLTAPSGEEFLLTADLSLQGAYQITKTADPTATDSAQHLSVRRTEPLLPCKEGRFRHPGRRVLLVQHRWRGGPPGGRVEPGETPREGARRELFEENGVEADLLPEPAAATVRSYHPQRPATLGLSYASIVDTGTPLAAESGQPAAWMSLDEDWDGYFPEDPSRIRQHAQWLREAFPR